MQISQAEEQNPSDNSFLKFEKSEHENYECSASSIKSVQELPYDILFTIVSSLSIRDLCMVEQVSPLFSDVSQKVTQTAHQTSIKVKLI
jgi:hypothetical protein